MKLNWSHWFYTLLKTVIGGVAATGSAWLGTLVGNQVDQAIPVLQFNQLWSVLLSSTLLNLFFFLKQSPLPEDTDANPPNPPSASRLVLLLIWGLLSFGLLPLGMGCRSAPVQVQAGSDPLVVNAEWLAENGANSLDQFLAFERQNEAALRGKFPQAHGMADLIRDDVVEIKPGQFVPASILKLRTLTKQYQADKTAANGDRVAAASKALLNLVNEVRGYMGVPALTFPAAHPSVMDMMQNAPTNAPPQ
jgi:hypothetical protein